MSSAICFNLNQSKILSSGNGLENVFIRIVSSNQAVQIKDQTAQNMQSDLNLHPPTKKKKE